MAVNPLLLVISVPLCVALINSFLPVIIRKILTIASLCFGMVLSFRALGTPIPDVRLDQFLIFSLDELGLFALFFTHVLALIILVFSLNGLNKSIEKSFFVWYPLTVSFCSGVIGSDHALSFLLFWGLAGLSLYAFALLGSGEETPQMAKKTFILIGGSDACLLMGLALLQHLQPAAQWSLAKTSIPLAGGNAVLAFILLLIAALTKAGGFPFHTWVPDFCKDAPVEGAALLPASLDKLLGIFFLAKMMTGLFQVSVSIHLIVMTIGALTIITAVMMAMNQHNARKLLGYHAVSQVGYMILGVGSGAVLAIAGGLFHLVNHTIYKSNLFLSLGSVEKRTGSNELNDLGGLARNMPITFVVALVGALSISGIPPFNGFFSKWMIYQGVLQSTAALTPALQLWSLLCLILAVFGSALTLASFMKFIYAVFLGRAKASFSTVREAPINQWLATGSLSILCIVFGIFAVPLPLKSFIFPIVEKLGPIDFLGTYQPLMILALFFIAFLLGLGIFLLVRRVRIDDIYLGGMAAEERFHLQGTSFYNEIRRMQPLASLYQAAENKNFDVYDLGTRSTFSFAHLFQRIHAGWLPIYLLFLIVGLILLLFLR